MPKFPVRFFFSSCSVSSIALLRNSSSVLGISFSAVFCRQLHSPAKLLFAVEEQTS